MRGWWNLMLLSVQYKDSKWLCYGNATNKYNDCKQTCSEIESMYQHIFCLISNFAMYLNACFYETMECYDITAYFSSLLIDASNDILSTLIENYDPINIGFLEMPFYSILGKYTQTFEDISITGLSSLEVENIDTGFSSLEPKINFSLPQLSINVDNFTPESNGFNVPFFSEVNLAIELIKLDGSIGFELESLLNPCAVEGSLKVDIGDEVEIKQKDSDTFAGNLIKRFLEINGPYILGFIRNQLNSGLLQAAIDTVFINSFNAFLDKFGFNCSHELLGN